MIISTHRELEIIVNVIWNNIFYDFMTTYIWYVQRGINEWLTLYSGDVDYSYIVLPHMMTYKHRV